MKRIRYGIVGFGFVGPHHVDAVRRLGFVDVVAVAGRNLDKVQRKAKAHYIPKAYGDYQSLVADPDIDVVDVATPTSMHYPIAMAAIACGKHVIVDKPLALTPSQAREMRNSANEANIVHAVTFNYRYHPVVQQARAAIRRGDLGQVRFIRGHYLQEWLMRNTDFSWRLEADKAGEACAAGDAGAHWYDLAEYLSGLRIIEVLADLNTVVKIRKRPLSQSTEAFAKSIDGQSEDYCVQGDDLSNVLLRFNNGAVGNFIASQVCAGHKNDLSIEINGSEASMAWKQERSEELWIGKRGEPNQLLSKDPPLLDEAVRSYAALPGGHNEGWPDAFRNIMQNILTFIAQKEDPHAADGILYPRFDEGYRNATIVDAIIRSHRSGGRWTAVEPVR